MKVQLIGRVLDVKPGKNGNQYVILNDTEEGGQTKLTMPSDVQIKIDALVNINAVVKPGIGNYGMYLTVVSLNKSESKEKEAN